MLHSSFQRRFLLPFDLCFLDGVNWPRFRQWSLTNGIFYRNFVNRFSRSVYLLYFRFFVCPIDLVYTRLLLFLSGFFRIRQRFSKNGSYFVILWNNLLIIIFLTVDFFNASFNINLMCSMLLCRPVPFYNFIKRSFD